MLKFIHFVIWIALWIGIGDALVRAVWSMRDSAIQAHQHDQLSYSKFTKMLTSVDKPSASQKTDQTHLRKEK